jgi:hypothetical protein
MLPPGFSEIDVRQYFPEFREGKASCILFRTLPTKTYFPGSAIFTPLSRQTEQSTTDLARRQVTKTASIVECGEEEH